RTVRRFGEKEPGARETCTGFCRRHGLAAAFDAVANLAVTPGAPQTEREVVLASHLDSVPRGGNFDGLAGVLAGVLVLAAMKASGARGKHGVRTYGFRCEESPWVGTAYLGSE